MAYKTNKQNQVRTSFPLTGGVLLALHNHAKISE